MTTTTAQWRGCNDDCHGCLIMVGGAKDEQNQMALLLSLPLKNISHVYEGKLKFSFTIFFCYTTQTLHIIFYE